MKRSARLRAHTIQYFSSDGSKFSFIFIKIGKEYLQINDKTFGPFDRVDYYFCPSVDMDRCFVFTKDGKKLLMINGKIVGTYEYDGISYMTFSPKRSRFAFIFRNENKPYVQVDNKIFGPFDDFDGIYYPHFSPDGMNIWFFLQKQGKYYIHINDKLFGPFDRIRKPNFSSTGTRYGFVFVVGDKKYVRIDDKTFGPFEDAGVPRFSSDGSKFWFTFRKEGGYYIKVNDKVFGPYKKIHKIYSHDGDYLVVIWEKDEEKGLYLYVTKILLM